MPIQIRSLLTSHYTFVRNHKSTQMTLEFNSSTRHVQIISKYQERLQHLCTIDELCVPALVGPDEMGEVADDIDGIFDWYHSIT